MARLDDVLDALVNDVATIKHTLNALVTALAMRETVDGLVPIEANLDVLLKERAAAAVEREKHLDWIMSSCEVFGPDRRTFLELALERNPEFLPITEADVSAYNLNGVSNPPDH